MGQNECERDSSVEKIDYDELSDSQRDDLAKRVARELQPSGTRRDALRTLGAAGIGVVAGGGSILTATQPASANPDESDIGSSSDPVDVYASNVYGPHGSIDFQDPVNTGQLSIRTAPTSSDDGATKQYVDQSVRSKTRAEELIDSPNGSIQAVSLQAGEGTKITQKVYNGETLTVYRWGVYRVSTGLAPAGLVVQIVDGSGNVVEQQHVNNNADTAGVASYTNTTGGGEVVALRAKNNTNNDYTDIAAMFGYEVN